MNKIFCFILFFNFQNLVAQPLATIAKNDSSYIQGWGLLSNDEESDLEVIKAAKAYNINHLQLSNQIMMDLQEMRIPAKRELTTKLINAAHQAGIKEVVAWDH